MSLFSKLFGGKSGAAETEAEIYEGFHLYIEPIKEPGGYRISARIEKEIGGEMKSHKMVRADVAQSLEEAQDLSLTKAKLFIDQMGDKIFG